MGGRCVPGPAGTAAAALLVDTDVSCCAQDICEWHLNLSFCNLPSEHELVPSMHTSLPPMNFFFSPLPNGTVGYFSSAETRVDILLMSPARVAFPLARRPPPPPSPSSLFFS